MILPNGEQAVVELSKLRDYCLDPSHAWGRHKARAFAAWLGIHRKHALWFRVALLKAAVSDEVKPGARDVFGARYVLDFTATGPHGSATVRSAWIIKSNEDFPRFLSAHVL